MKALIKKIEWSKAAYQWRHWLAFDCPGRLRKVFISVLPEILIYDPLPDFESGEEWSEWSM